MRAALSCLLMVAVFCSVSAGPPAASSTLVPAPPPPQCGDATSLPPINVAVLGDGYTASQQAVFSAASKDLLCNGAVMKEPFFQAMQSKFAVTPLSVVSPQEGIPRRGEAAKSGLGLVYNGLRDECFFDVSSDALLTLYDEPAKVNLSHSRLLVIANMDSQSVGCAFGRGVTILTSGANWKTLAHELGHSLGLRDEYVDLEGAAPTITDRSNCSSVNPPWWTSASAGIANARAVPGCDRYASPYRSFATCRMRAAGHDFCATCAHLMTTALGGQTNANPNAPVVPPTKGTRLLFEVSQGSPLVPSSMQARVVGKRDVANATIPALTRGDAIAVILAGDAVVGAAPAGELIDRRNRLTRRVYGGASPTPDQVQLANRVLLAVDVPDRSIAQLANQQVEMRIVRISDQVDGQITLQMLNIAGLTTVLRVRDVQDQIR